MIIKCNSCQKGLKLPDAAAGKKVKCPVCGTILSIPSNVAGAADVKPSAAPPSQTPVKKKPRLSSAPPADPSPADADNPVRRKRSRSAGDAPGSTGRAQKKKSQAVRPPQSEPARRRKRRPKPFEEYDEYDGGDSLYGDFDEVEEFDDAYDPYSAPRSRDQPRRSKKSKKGKGQNLSLVGMGLIVHVSSLLAALLIVIGGTLMLMASNAGPANLSTIKMISILTGIAGIGMLVGELMCLAVPNTVSAKWLIVATVCCTVIVFILRLTGPSNLSQVQVFAVANFFMAIGRIVFYMLFLRGIANYVGREQLATAAMVILIGFPITLTVWGGFNFLIMYSAVPGRGMAVMSIISSIATIIAMLVFGVMYIFLHFRLGFALRNK